MLESDGTVTVHIGTQSTGQGHQTAYAQFVVGPLALDYDKVRVVQGDTDALERGGGTGGSRSIPLGAPSVDRASRQLAEQMELAADELEAGIGDIELTDGRARVVGTDRAITYAELARKPPTRASSPPSASSRRRSTPTRTARMSARSRSIRTPAAPTSSATRSSTTSARP